MSQATPGRGRINYSWTTDNDPDIIHRRLIGYGGSGQVHEVLL
jgi:hypothetical protein